MEKDVMLRASPETKERVAQIVEEWKKRRGETSQKKVVEELVMREWRALFWPGAEDVSAYQEPQDNVVYAGKESGAKVRFNIPGVTRDGAKEQQ